MQWSENQFDSIQNWNCNLFEELPMNLVYLFSYWIWYKNIVHNSTFCFSVWSPSWSWMGYPGSAGSAKCEILYLLLRALLGHHFQHYNAKKNPFLHGEPNNTLYGHFLSDYFGLLLAIR